MITEETRAYLDGNGTESQQELFQSASETLEAVYRHANPRTEDENEADYRADMADLLAEQYSGAAQYALGDSTLESLGGARTRAQRQLLDATDQLRGACVAAFELGLPKKKIAEKAGITRPTLDTWLDQ